MKRNILAVFLILLLIAPALAQQNTVSIQDKTGNWLLLQMNSKTGSAHRVYGHLPDISLYGFRYDNLNQMSIEGLSSKFFSDYSSILKIDPAQMKLSKAETDGKMWFVSYAQVFNSVPIYGTEIGYTINQKGDVVTLGADAYPNISISTSPSITKSAAESVAQKAFGFDSTVVEKECVLIIYPKEEKDTTNLYLAWKVTLFRMNPLEDI